MSNYFQHKSISNSDLKKFGVMMGIEREAPANLQAIFDFGTLFHKVILEPHLVDDADRAHADYPLAKKMGETYFKDPLCRMIINGHDFEREHEFYETVEVGGMRYNSRCKADGYRPGMMTFLELKGLATTNQKAFEDALLMLDYDRAVVHYMLTSKTDKTLIVGISKKKPELMFKKVVKKHDNFYAEGEEKLIQRLKLLRSMSPDDVQLI